MVRWFAVLVLGAVGMFGCQPAEGDGVAQSDPEKAAHPAAVEPAATAANAAVGKAVDEPAAMGCGQHAAAADSPAETPCGDCPHAAKGGCAHAAKCGSVAKDKPRPGAAGEPCEDCKAKGGCPHAKNNDAKNNDAKNNDAKPCPCKAGGECPHAGS